MVGFLFLFDGGSRVSSQNIIMSLVRMGQRKMSDLLTVEDIPLFYGPNQHFMSHFFTIQPDTRWKTYSD
jgi:hypothetical protein